MIAHWNNNNNNTPNMFWRPPYEVPRMHTVAYDGTYLRGNMLAPELLTKNYAIMHKFHYDQVESHRFVAKMHQRSKSYLKFP